MKIYMIENEDDFVGLIADFLDEMVNGPWVENRSDTDYLPEVVYDESIEVICVRGEFTTIYTKEYFFNTFLKDNTESFQMIYYKAKPTFTFSEILQMPNWNNSTKISAKHNNLSEYGYKNLRDFLGAMWMEYSSEDIHDILKNTRFYFDSDDDNLLPED